MIDVIIFSAIVVLTYMTFMFIIALIIKDNSIADIGWGLGFIIAAFSSMLYFKSFELKHIIVVTCVLIWGLRLSIRIGKRNIGHGEDWRYKKWRKEWGQFFIIRSFLQVFILQGFILVINILPVLAILSNNNINFKILDYIGLIIWTIGFFYEAIGDYQLDVFIKNPSNKNKIINVGLWKNTRHPNYFGEVTMWWGIFIMALSVPYGWTSIIGPLTITCMILFVSGIPMTERAMEKIPGFDEYKRTTSIFIPWLRKK